MTPQSVSLPKPASRRPLRVGAAALVALAVWGFAEPRAVLHGWLIAFAFVGGVPLGAVALLMIHRLTGGRWGEAARPPLAAAAAVLPSLAAFVLPLLLASRVVYPWAEDPARAGPGVATLYLDPLLVGCRSLVGIGMLGIAAWRLVGGRLGTLGAGLGLVAYAVFMNAASYDWLLSIAPRFTSSAFGAQIIVAQLLSALCFAVLTLRASADDPVWPDLGALILAVALGEAYLVLMSFIVHWYGNLPDQAEWYLERTRGGWAWLAAAGVAAGAVAPIAALLFERVRTEPALLRPVAALLLAWCLSEDVWLVAPATESLAAVAALLAVIGLGATIIGLAAPMVARMEGGPRGA